MKFFCKKCEKITTVPCKCNGDYDILMENNDEKFLVSLVTSFLKDHYILNCFVEKKLIKSLIKMGFLTSHIVIRKIHKKNREFQYLTKSGDKFWHKIIIKYLLVKM